MAEGLYPSLLPLYSRHIYIVVTMGTTSET